MKQEQTTYAARRVSSEAAAAEYMNKQAAEGFVLAGVSGTGHNGEHLWIVMRRTVVIEVPVTPAVPGQQQVGGGLVGG